MNKLERIILGILLIGSLLLIVFNVDLNKSPSCKRGCELPTELKEKLK